MNIYQLNNIKGKRITLSDLENQEKITKLKIRGSRQEYIDSSFVIHTEVNLYELTVTHTPLKDIQGSQSENRITCFSTEGIDKFGKKFTNPINIKENSVKEIFLGFDLRGLDIGKYKSILTIKDKFSSKELEITVDVTNDEIEEKLENINYKMEWLNSTIGIDDAILPPYTPIKIDNRVIEILGRKILIGKDGLVDQVVGYYDDSLYVNDSPQSTLFAAPMEFILQRLDLEQKSLDIRGSSAEALITSIQENERVKVEITATVDYVGLMKYNVRIIAKEDVTLPSIDMKLYFDAKCAKYSMGLGKLGGKFENLNFRFNDANNQDTLYVGSARLGCAVKFVASDECEPFGSRVFDVPKKSWDNYGKGIVEAVLYENVAEVTASSGLFVLPKDEVADFSFDFALTPFSPFELKKDFNDRFSYVNVVKTDEKSIAVARRYNANNLILDSGNRVYQAANNPYLSAKEIEKFLIEARETYDSKTILCYDLNFLSSTNNIFKQLSSLDDGIIVNAYQETDKDVAVDTELIDDGVEVKPIMQGSSSVKVGNNYVGADMIYAVDPKSRYCNLFVKSVDELINKLPLNGIFLSNTVMDGFTLNRIRKVLKSNSRNGFLGLYISDQRNDENGNASGFNKHMQALPYLDKIVLGTECKKHREPEYYLTELSGLLFGVTCNVVGLENPYLSMLHGMSPQAGMGAGNPTILYDIWNKFNIGDSRIMGYWMDVPPIISDYKDVKVTTFAKSDSCLAVFYNFSDETLNIEFGIDPEILGFSTKDKEMRIITTKGKKTYKKIKKIDEGIKVKGKEGLIIQIG